MRSVGWPGVPPCGGPAGAPGGPVAVRRPSVTVTGPEEEGPLESPRWQRYPSINDVDLDQVDEIRRAVRGSDIEFVAVEKVHGSNFAFETDGRSIDYFSRSRRLEKHGRFVGKTAPAEAMRQYHAAVRETFRVCASRTAQGVKSVVVYGEYFGGWYPHPQVEQEGPGAGVPVQKGIVAYGPRTTSSPSTSVLTAASWILMTQRGCSQVPA